MDDVSTLPPDKYPCAYCGAGHAGICARVKAIEYHESGAIKRVEFHELVDIVLPTGGFVAGEWNVLYARTGHCGGTDYEDVAAVTDETANALVAEGVRDERYGNPREKT